MKQGFADFSNGYLVLLRTCLVTAVNSVGEYDRGRGRLP